MTADDATLAVIRALEAAQVPYMIVGSLSSNFYGLARSTKDVDFVVQLGDTRLSAVLAQLGPEFQLNRQVTFETITGTIRHVVDVAHIAYRIELFQLSTDPHDQVRFQRRGRHFVPHLNAFAFLPTVEDVIITKLNWSRNSQRGKDREDVRDVIAVQGDRIDWNYVHPWCEQHGTRQILDEIRRSIPPI